MSGWIDGIEKISAQLLLDSLGQIATYVARRLAGDHPDASEIADALRRRAIAAAMEAFEREAEFQLTLRDLRTGLDKLQTGAGDVVKALEIRAGKRMSLFDLIDVEIVEELPPPFEPKDPEDHK